MTITTRETRQPDASPPAAPLLARRGTGRAGDRAFAALTTGSGLAIVALVALVGGFLVVKAVPSLLNDQASFLTSRVWEPAGDPPRFGIAAMLWTTVLSSVVAMTLAVPVAVAVALFITQYAPARLATPVAYLVDLLAAVPSIIFGLWGIQVLAPKLGPVRDVIESAFGWFFLFAPTGTSAGNVFTASVVLAIMILPIITAISREVFRQVPRANVEAALALGATRWETIRLTVLPFGRPGVIAAAMLGLGRALGETIAVTIILSAPNSRAPFDLSVFFGGETFASKIANSAAEFDTPQKTGAYIAAGLVLFVVTFAVNAVARLVVARRTEV